MFSFSSFRFTLLPVLFCCSSTLRKKLNWIKFDYLEKKSRRWTNKVDVFFSKISNEDTWIIIRRIKISALICNFTCEITELPWQPFCTSQCQDGDEVLKRREWKCQGTKTWTHKRTSRRILRYFAENVWKILNFISQI